MLVEFRVKNFRSICDEQVLSLVASKDKSLPHNVIERGGLRLLRTVGVYGSNASGKSNLIGALEHMKQLVLHSAFMESERELPLRAFAFEPNIKTGPCTFEATFLIDKVRYQYGFSATRKQVEDEWLYAYPNNVAQKWFERSVSEDSGHTKWSWGASLKGEKARLAQKTRAKVLFLSVAAQWNQEQLTPIYKWFDRGLRVISPFGPPPRSTAVAISDQDVDSKVRANVKHLVLELLRAADMGIKDIRVTRSQIEEIGGTGKLLIDSLEEELREKVRENVKRRFLLKVQFLHSLDSEGPKHLLDLRDESDGTRRIFDLAVSWVDTVVNGNLIAIDEMDRSLHPLLTRHLISFLRELDVSKAGAQLLFTTHDTTLMDPELFRRDQIYFVEKDNRGKSSLYSLAEYREHRSRKGEALQKSYLAGRYGAIPILEAFEVETGKGKKKI